MARLKHLLLKPTVIIAVLVFVALGAYAFTRDGGAPAYETAVASRDDLVQTVSVTGRVRPIAEAELGLEKGGKVAAILADVGESVFAGQTIVRLESNDLQAQYEQAQAMLDIQRVTLDELNRGTRPEEISVQEVRVANAEVSIGEAKTNLIETIQDAYTKADNAIRNYVDQFYTNPESSTPRVTLSIYDVQTKADAEWGRLTVGSVLSSWGDKLAGVTSASDLPLAVSQAKEHLTEIKIFLDTVALVVNAANPTGTITQTTIDAYKAAVVTARTNINTAISAISTAEEKLKTANATLSLEEQNLTLALAGATPEAIRAQEARIAEAQANVKQYEAQLAKTVIRSPIKGVVTKLDIEIGEFVSAGETVVSVISDSAYEIEAYIPEADIAKVSLGNRATFTLDAYRDDEMFEAEVYRIDPAETVIGGVPTYKINLLLSDDAERVRSGMTANLDIVTDERRDVIAIPMRAVLSENGTRQVRILASDGNVEMRPVTVGLYASDGRAEVISGIVAGETVILFIND